MSSAIPAMLATQLIWGVAPVFVRHLSTTLGAADSIIIRYTLVSLAYLPLLFWGGRWKLERQDWARMGLAALTGIFGYNIGSSFGFERVGAGLGGLIIGTQPLIIALLAAVMEREPITRATLAGLLIAFAGTVLIFWPDLQAGNLGLISGALMIFGSGLCWGFYVIASRPLIRKYGTLPVTAWSMILATLPMWLLADASTPANVLGMDAGQWFAMLYMAFFSTFVASLTWNYASARLSASVAGAFLYLVPVIAVIAGVLLLDEQVTLSLLGGGGLVLAGVAVAQIKPASGKTKP